MKKDRSPFDVAPSRHGGTASSGTALVPVRSFSSSSSKSPLKFWRVLETFGADFFCTRCVKKNPLLAKRLAPYFCPSSLFSGFLRFSPVFCYQFFSPRPPHKKRQSPSTLLLHSAFFLPLPPLFWSCLELFGVDFLFWSPVPKSRNTTCRAEAQRRREHETRNITNCN
jgi:hypothetical protein